jgi:hypothetical protein
MTEPIKPAGWLVLDPEGGYEYGCMDPDYGRDFCHDHIKDAQESGIPRARKWVVRESFSRDQVEQNTAELKAEVERLRAELARLTRPNLFWVSGGEGAACEELGEMAERIAEDFYGDARECTETIDCARTLPSVQMRVWINDEGGVDFECPILDVKEPK